MNSLEKADENLFRESINDPSKTSFLPLPLSEVERRKSQLLDADFKVGFQVASELNEQLGEICNNTAAFQSFLPLIPILLSVIARRTRPNPNVDAVESKYRKVILDILMKLPQNELLRSHVSHILLTVMDVLKNDYEGNGLVAARIVLDLHKNYRPTLADFVQSFLDFMANCYRTLPTNAVQNFEIALNNVVNASQVSPPPHSLAPGMASMTAPAGPTATATFENTLSNPFNTTSVIPMPISTIVQPSKKLLASSKPMTVVVSSSEKFCATSLPATTLGQPSTNVPTNSSAALYSLETNPSAHFGGKLNLTPRSIKSSASFLVLAECPVIAILIFQNYAKVIPANLSTLLPLMVEGLAILPPTLPVPPASKNSDYPIQQQQALHRLRARELVACQVKTLSFLVYLIRGSTDQVHRHEDHICKNVVSLLTTCPIDAIATRKELLVAVRHIIATSFRKGFFKYIDALLDDRVLAGGRFSMIHRRNNISEYYATILSPLNYSALADLVHYARSRFTLHQHARVIHIFSRVIHDSSLSVTIHTMAARLLLNLVDFIFHSKEANWNTVGRDLLVRILFTLVMKFGTLREYIPIVAKNQAISVGIDVDLRDELYSDVSPKVDLTTEERLLRQVKQYPSPVFVDSGGGAGGSFMSGIGGGHAAHKDSIADIQALVPPLFVGLKSLIWCINNYQTAPSRYPNTILAKDETQEVTSAENDDDSKLRITIEELEILSKYVKWGLDCIRELKISSITILTTHTSGSSTQAINNAAGFDNDAKSESKHERRCETYRDILDKFAGSLSILDGRNFRVLIAPLLPFLIDYAGSDKDMLVFFRHFFLSSKAASYHICDIVLEYLVIDLNNNLLDHTVLVSQIGPQDVKIRETAESDVKETVVLALFKLVFQSISIFPANETVLRPKLQKIIASSLKFYGEITEWSRFHYILLRALFRTITSGKFELSYEEILPLVPAILNGLYRIHCCTENDRLRASVADLCLMIPARLSSLLPHIPLLLRIIVFALQTPYPDLVNLGLKTLDFWVDNLNPEFFSPILNQNSQLLTELMTSLSNHLNPSQPFGMLSLSILGKLGGKNRTFFREPYSSSSGSPEFSIKTASSALNLLCRWTISDSSAIGSSGMCSGDLLSDHVVVRTDEDQCHFTIPVDAPSYTAIAILRRSGTHSSHMSSREETQRYQFVLDNKKLECANIVEISSSVTLATEESLIRSSFDFLRSMIVSLIDFIPIDGLEYAKIPPKPSTSFSKLDCSAAGILLGNIVKGLFYATSKCNLKTEAITLIKSLAFRMILIVHRNLDCIVRVDAGGRAFTEKAANDFPVTHSLKNMENKDVANSPKELTTASDKLGPMEQLGSFKLIGRLQNVIDPFVLCKSLTAVLCEENSDWHGTALHIMDAIVEKLHKLCAQATAEETTFFCDSGVGTVVLENLLLHVSQSCFSQPWNLRIGPFSAILRLCHSMGSVWASKYQDVLMHAALFSVKDSPREIPSAGRYSLAFCIKVFTLLYGAPLASADTCGAIISDSLTVCSSYELESRVNHESKVPAPTEASGMDTPSGDIRQRKTSTVMSQTVLSMLVTEMNSTKNISRFASRYCLQQYALVNGCCMEDLLGKSVTFFRKALFSRSLRTLPLKEQVGATQALAFIIDSAPSLFPLIDQDILALLSELLKMTAIADGVMTAKEGENFPLVDKDGFVSSAQTAETKKQTSKHSSSMFFADSFTLLPSETGGMHINVPPDLPDGVQLRVTALMLFRAVIRRHTDLFFDAPSSDAVGNIRPHVISLFFRSLVSEPVQVVAASHLALKDVLALGMNNATSHIDNQQTKSLSHRLSKELLQTCIRPVLLNLRDHTKLTVPLLRGLSRLLSLLATWFNKTLGEKLLEHLRRWECVDKAKGVREWKSGEESSIAASIIRVFELLPQASSFTESLVSVVIKLESAFRHHCAVESSSPYRTPLVCFFNRYPSAVADYFLTSSSLTDNSISEVLQSALRRHDAVALRRYFSGPDATRKILSLCFEKPLAIIRSEKSTTATKITRSADEILAQHGIPKIKMTTGRKENSETIPRRCDADRKPKSQAVLGKIKVAPSTVSQKVGESSRKPHHICSTSEKEQKEVSFHQKVNVNDTAKSKPLTASASSGNVERVAVMSDDTLELQYQGFRIISALMENDPGYLQEPYHADIVRTFRWLWHSKGRHLRLLHEELLPARYLLESKSISAVLMHYAKIRPSDADILFDLLRIFLEQTSVDFSDIRRFLEDMVTNVLTTEDKKRVLMRFFDILESDRPEETKVLSMHYLIFPMLHACFTESNAGLTLPSMTTGQVVIDKEMTNRLISGAFVQDRKCGERLQIEILRLLTLLVKYRFRDLYDQRNNLLKLAWEKVDRAESPSKLWAYVYASFFIHKFETPSKLVLQVYFGLLKAYHRESQDLTTEALAALIPCLPTCLNEHELENCMKDTGKIILDERHGILQLTHILQIIVHFPNVYFEYNKYFVNIITGSLSRLGLSQNRTIESWALSLSLCDLLLKWEAKRLDFIAAGAVRHSSMRNTASKEVCKPTQDSDIGSPQAKKLKLVSDIVDKKYVSPTQVNHFKDWKNGVVNFLIRSAFVAGEAKEEHCVTLGDRSFILLKAALQTGCEVILDMSPFESLSLLCSQDAFCSFLLNEQIKCSMNNFKDEFLVRKEDGGVPVESEGVSANKANANSDRESRISVSVNQLKAFLQISTIVMQTRRYGDDFFFKTNGRLNAVLAACLNYAMQEDGELIRIHLKVFLLAFFSRGVFYPSQIMSDVKLLMGNALIWSSQLMLDCIESRKSCASTSSLAVTGETAVSPITKINFFGVFILQAIDEVCKRGKFGILESLTGVLIEVLGFLSHGELLIIENHELSYSKFATTTMGIIQQGYAEKDPFDQRKKESSTLNRYSDCGTAVTALIICMRLLAESSIPYTFSLKRRSFFSILGMILDTSNNIMILTSCVAVIHSWITDKCDCPMTSTEIVSFIGKMTQLDSRCLSDSAAQPMYELIANAVSFLCRCQKSSLKIVSCGGSGDENLKSSLAVPTTIKKEESDLSQNYLFSRVLVAALMCSNPVVRFSALLVIGAQQHRLGYDRAQKTHSIDHLPRFGGIPGRSPIDILSHMFSSDSEGVGSRYWIAIFVDLLIAASDHTGNLELVTCNTSDSTNPMREYVPGKNSAASIENVISEEGSSNSSYPCAVVTSLDSQFNNYEAFVDEIQSDAELVKGSCLSALRVLIYSDVSLCHSLFRSLMCSAYTRFRHTDKEYYFAQAMEKLLSHPCHSQFLKGCSFLTCDKSIYYTNCVKAFLGVVICLRPVPYLNPDLLLSLASHYNAWHEVIFLLENYITMSGAHIEFKIKLLSSLQMCYASLGENDMRLNVGMKLACHSSTIRACTLEIYGRVDAAVSLYESLFQQEGENSILSMSSRELSFWEERWVELNRELCRWDVLKDYGNAKKLESLMMESAWKSRDWETLRRLCETPSNVAYLELGEPLLKIYEMYLSVAEENMNSVESLYFQAGQLCLYKWQLLPHGASSCGTKKVLLHYFHRLVELLESSKMLNESEAYTKNGSLPDFKNQLNVWRERIPNEYDSLVVWEDLFTWRSHVYSSFSSKFHWSDDGSLAEIHDRPWTSIQIARVARKQGKKDVALMSLSKLTDCAMDVNDAFSKLREQIMLYLHSKTSDELCGGLNLVNTTNLSFFDEAQKSEIFRLKASFLNSLGARAKANQAYCQSLQICPTHAKSWLSWGHLCFSLAELTEKQDNSSSAPGADTSKTVPVDKKAMQYYSQSMGCYFEAIRCGSHNWTLICIPRCLWLLRKDVRSPGLLCQTFEMRSKLLPEWVWLPWTSQLLSSLGRTEAAPVSKILKAVLARYPQSIYFGLRAYYLERRDVERAHKSTGSSTQQHVPSVSYAEDLMSSLRRAQPQLWLSLEAILEELIIRFRPSLEEELLSTINALLLRGLNQLESTKVDDVIHDGKSDDISAEVANFQKTLEKIAAKFFRSPATNGSEVANINCVWDKSVEFSARYKDSFERDFLRPETAAAHRRPMSKDSERLDSSFPLTLEDIVRQLRKWQRTLERSIVSVPSFVALHNLSPLLTVFSCEPPDMWEGACDPRFSTDILNTDHLTAPTLPSTSAVAALAAASAASASVAKNAASEGVGGYFGGGSTSVEIPGQYSPYHAIDSKPQPELHAKLIRFEPTVEIIKLPDDRQLVRRITMMGSDGKKYHFLLQFNSSYYARVDEHCAQLHYVTNKVLRKGLLSSRKNLSIQCNVVVPIAQRLRLIADDIGNFSLDSVISSDMRSRSLPNDAVQLFFKDECSKRLKETVHVISEKNKTQVATELHSENDKATPDLNIKLAVYQEICDGMVKNNILSKYLYNASQSMESLYAFRKRFAVQWAIESLLQYAFNVVDRTPSRLVINIDTGQVVPTEFRISYNNQGLVEGNKLPFRLTRNIENLIGPFMIGGVFVPAMASGAEAFKCVDEELNPALCVILRDDIVSWYCSKSPPRSDSKNQELERQLGERIVKNVSLAQRRMLECSPDTEMGTDKQDAADLHLRKLLHVATSPENLCEAPLPFQPWF